MTEDSKTEKLTPQEEALIPIVRQEWIDLVLHSGKEVKREEIESDIEWVYKKLNLPKPLLFLADSHVAQKHMINVVIGTNPKEIQNKINSKDKVKPMESFKLPPTEWPNTLNQVINQATEQYLQQLEKPSHRTKAECLTIIRNEILAHLPEKLERYELYFGLSHDTWLSFYDFFTRIGKVNNEDFNRYMAFMKKGIWNLVMADEAAFVAKMPIEVKYDDNMRLSNDRGAAITFRDGTKHHYIRNIYFKPDLFEKITTKTLPVKEILQLENMEQRMMALHIYGPERLLQEVDAVKIDSWKEYELYQIEGLIEGRKLKLLKYPDPSTDRVYMSFVPDECSTCRAAKAKKFQIEESEVDLIKVEA